MSDGIHCMWMRGCTSKGGYFIADDIPKNRDAFLLQVMGLPDSRQIDGMSGADPLTSKVAIIKKSDRAGVDVDYLFDGVPGTAAGVPIEFKDTAGSSCGALLPTANVVDKIDDISVTMIDNGMPIVILKASDVGISGLETRTELDANEPLKAQLEAIRL